MTVDLVRTVQREDVLLRLGRFGLYMVLLLSSLLVARVGDYTAGDIVLVLTVAVVLFAVAVENVPQRHPRLPVMSLLILATVVGGGALAGFRAQSTASTLAVVARLVLVILVLPWLCKVLLGRPELVRRAMTAFALGCGISGGGTLLQFILGPSVIPGTGVTDAGRFAGFTQNVSDTGGVSCAGVVLALALLVSAERRSARVVPVISLIGAGFGLVLSGSVSGLISTVVGVVVLLITGVLRPRTAVLTLVLAAALLAVATVIQTDAGALNPLQRILQTTGNSADARYDTAGSRVDTYAVAFAKIQHDPLFGAGLDPNSSIVDGIYPAHNLFIAAMYGGGVLLTAGIALAVFRPLGSGLLRKRREPLVAIALAVVVTEFVFAMTAPSLYNRYFWIPLALLAAALAVERGAEERPVDDAPGEESRTPAAPASSRLPDAVLWARAGDPVRRRSVARHSG